MLLIFFSFGNNEKKNKSVISNVLYDFVLLFGWNKVYFLYWEKNDENLKWLKEMMKRKQRKEVFYAVKNMNWQN